MLVVVAGVLTQAQVEQVALAVVVLVETLEMQHQVRQIQAVAAVEFTQRILLVTVVQAS
jgi:hypothetical protein